MSIQLENKTNEEKLLEKYMICKFHNRQLLKEPSLLKIEIGKLQSEKQELEYFLEQEKIKFQILETKYNQVNSYLDLKKLKEEVDKGNLIENLNKKINTLKQRRKKEHSIYVNFRKEYLKMRDELINLKNKL